MIKSFFLMKIALMGDGAVGKTSIRRRYLGKGFSSSYMKTIGADFALKELQIRDKPMKFQIWDLAGQPRFAAVRSVFYRGSLGGLLVFDVTRPDSFMNLENWLKDFFVFNGKGEIPVVIIGNKKDLRGHVGETISPEQGAAFAERVTKSMELKGVKCHYLETSAKTGENIDLAFEHLGSAYLEFVEQNLKSQERRSFLRKSVDQLLKKTFSGLSDDLFHYFKSITSISEADEVLMTIDRSQLLRRLLSIEDKLAVFFDKRDFQFDLLDDLDPNQILLILSLLDALTNCMEGSPSDRVLQVFKEWIYLLNEHIILKMIIDTRNLSIEPKFSNTLIKCCNYFRSRESPRAKTLSLLLMLLRELYGSPLEDVLDEDLKVYYQRFFHSKDQDLTRFRSLLGNFANRGEPWQFHQIVEFFLDEEAKIFFSEMHKKALFSLLKTLKEISSRFHVEMKLILERGDDDLLKVEIAVDDVTEHNIGFEWNLELLYVGKKHIDEKQEFSGQFKSDVHPHLISREFHPVDTGLHIFQLFFHEPISDFSQYYQTHIDYKKKSDLGEGDLSIVDTIKDLWKSHLDFTPTGLPKDSIIQELVILYNLVKFMDIKTINQIEPVYRSIIGKILSHFLDLEEISETKRLVQVEQHLNHFQHIDPYLLTVSKDLIQYDLNNEYFNNNYHIVNIFSHLGVVIEGITKYRKTLTQKIDYVPKGNQIIILFTHANPRNNRLQLRVNREINEIRDQIIKEKYYDKIYEKSYGALIFEQIPELLRRHSPNILHFTGHGEEDGYLVLVNEKGYAKKLELTQFVNAIKHHKDHLRLIVLNACWSADFAKALTEFIDCVIGWKTEVNEDAAINFCVHLFKGLVGGLSIGASVESSLNLNKHLIPDPKKVRIETREGINEYDIGLSDLIYK